MANIANWADEQRSRFREGVGDPLSNIMDDSRQVVGSVEAELYDISDILNRLNKNMPHYRNAQAARNNWEPVYLNQFDVIITPPERVFGTGYFADLIAEQVKSVKGLPEIVPTGTVEQKYLWAKRTFSSPVPEDSTAELEIAFEVNLNNRNSMYTYELLRAWSDLSFNQYQGIHGLRRDYTGQMTILVHNKVRRVFRQFDFRPVYITEPFNSMELDYLSDEIYVLTAKFKADGWSEKRNGEIKPEINNKK
jgi:hypothetical protein